MTVGSDAEASAHQHRCVRCMGLSRAAEWRAGPGGPGGPLPGGLVPGGPVPGGPEAGRHSRGRKRRPAVTAAAQRRRWISESSGCYCPNQGSLLERPCAPRANTDPPVGLTKDVVAAGGVGGCKSDTTACQDFVGVVRGSSRERHDGPFYICYIAGECSHEQSARGYAHV